MARIEIGKNLAADSRICGGRLVLKGSRILVADLLELAQNGYSAAAIAEQYRGLVRPAAIREALTLVRQGVVREIVGRDKSAA